MYFVFSVKLVLLTVLLRTDKGNHRNFFFLITWKDRIYSLKVIYFSRLTLILFLITCALSTFINLSEIKVLFAPTLLFV